MHCLDLGDYAASKPLFFSFGIGNVADTTLAVCIRVGVDYDYNRN